MEDKNEINKQKLKQLEEIFKEIKKETGYDLEKFSDLSDFMFDLKMLSFNKKNNKIEVEKRQKLLEKVLENDEKIDEDFEKNVEENENNSSNNHQENNKNFQKY